MTFCHRTRTKNFTICMETQKTPNIQSSLEKEEWSWRNQSSWRQSILQSYSHQDSMGLAQKQKHRPMEQDTAAAAKSRQSCPTLCDPINDSPPSSHPWDSPGKNTGVGCHFPLQCMKVKSKSEVVQSCLTLRDPMDCSLPGSLSMGFSRQEYWSGLPLSLPGTR